MVEGGVVSMQNKASLTRTQKVPGGPECPSRTATWKSQPENAGSHSVCLEVTGCISSARFEVHHHCKSEGFLAGVQCPAPRCLVALDSAVLIGWGSCGISLRYIIKCGIVVWRTATALFYCRTKQEKVLLYWGQDVLICWRRYRDLEPVTFWGLPSGDRWELRIILSNMSWFQILFSLLLTLQLPRDIYRFWVQVSMFC